MSQFFTILPILKAQLGKPYEYGATGPDKFDCSGLMQFCFREALSVELPRTSKDQFAVGTIVDKDKIQLGDLIFFDTKASSTVPNHVGICTDIGKMINANSYNQAVVEESYQSSYWDKAYYGARRVLEQTSPFSDVLVTDEFYPYIMDLYNDGVIAGYPDGTFKPEQGINRAEVLKVILLAFKIPIEEGTSGLIFSDVLATDWFYPYVLTAFNQGIVQGYPDGTFKPGNLVNRVETLKMILQTAGVTLPTTGTITFEDVKPEQWFYYYVVYALDKSLIAPLSVTKFGSGEAMKRGEVCQGVSKVLAL